MPLSEYLPEGLITFDELGVMSEVDDLDEQNNLYKLADLVIRATGVMVRHASQQPTWTVETVPVEARVININFARRVFNNPQNQQRIQTGPLADSYSTDELTGLLLTDSEEALLETFQDVEDGDLGGLGIISIQRPDPLPPFDNRIFAPAQGLGNPAHPYYLPMSSLGKYLGTGEGV